MLTGISFTATSHLQTQPAGRVTIHQEPTTRLDGARVPAAQSIVLPTQPRQSADNLQLQARAESEIQPEQQNHLVLKANLIGPAQETRALPQTAEEPEAPQQVKDQLQQLASEATQVSNRRDRLEEEKSAIEAALNELAKRESEIQRERSRLQQTLGTLVDLKV